MIEKEEAGFFSFGSGLGKFLPNNYFDAVWLHCNSNSGRSLGSLLGCFVWFLVFFITSLSCLIYISVNRNILQC